MPRMIFTSDMFPSDQSINIKKKHKKHVATDDRWRSYAEFIAFCIGKHSIWAVIIHFRNLNFVQDLIIYILVGIPVCYMQLVLGQYTNLGIFLIRRMLPLAEGISIVYFLTMFTLTIIIVTEMEASLIYLLLSISPHKLVWYTCPPKYKNACWDFSQACTPEVPCMNETIEVPTYIFWNDTFMKGALPIHKARFGFPDYRIILFTMVCWILIYLLTILKFHVIKRSVQILVAISVIAKLIFFCQYVETLGLGSLLAEIIRVDLRSFYSISSWSSSISRVISSMMLGDFIYIMFGVFASYSAQTGSLSFTGAICGYFVLIVESLNLKGAILVLVRASRIDPSNAEVFYVQHAPATFILMPASLGVLKRPNVWVVFYFFMTLITYLVWCVINIAFMQQSLYQRFEGIKSHYKYICPAFCLAGFSVGIVIQTREFYEIRYDLTQLVDSFCQHINLILLTVMTVYIYGFMRLGDDIQFMTGTQPALFWKLTWLVSPILMMITVPTEYFDNKHPFFMIRMIIILVVFSPIAIYALIFIMKKVYYRDMLSLLKPDPLWGPMDEKLRLERNKFRPRKQTKYQRYYIECPHKCLLGSHIQAKVLKEEVYYDRTALHIHLYEEEEAI